MGFYKGVCYAGVRIRGQFPGKTTESKNEKKRRQEDKASSKYLRWSLDLRWKMLYVASLCFPAMAGNGFRLRLSEGEGTALMSTVRAILYQLRQIPEGLISFSGTQTQGYDSTSDSSK